MLRTTLLIAVVFGVVSCGGGEPTTPKAEAPIARPEPPAFTPGTSIVVNDRRVDIGHPVVLWSDPVLLRDGKRPFNAYEKVCRDRDSDYPMEVASRPSKTPDDLLRYGAREPNRLSRAAALKVRTSGWSDALLRDQITQFVLHYDAVGSSTRCFRALHDNRGLSVHFMIDLDGTIYQTLDVRERAFHAGDANDHSIGVEIASVGAYSTPKFLEPYYVAEPDGIRHAFPPHVDFGKLQRRDVVPKPARPNLVSGKIHGRTWVQYDFTPEQYTALFHLGGALCGAFPKIRVRVPRDPKGRVLPDALPETERNRFEGIVGHWHLTKTKYDPGPAFDWDTTLDGIRTYMNRRKPR